MAIYLSGIQASGNPHIGNYIGAILNWKNLLNNANKEDQFFFMIADLHSLTTVKNAKVLLENINQCIAFYVACGLLNFDANIKLFRQSKIPTHSELCWILSTITPLGQLERMTQFKDKKQKKPEDINSGLLFYPILMAADILLYNADYVPVGDDQLQHIELTRDIAEKFNNIYENFFTLPKPIITQQRRIMSLTDGSMKMSKDSPNDSSRINISDSNELIYQKIKTAKTDSITGIYHDPVNRPEISNLISIFATFSNKTTNEIEEFYKDKKTSEFKMDLANILIQEMAPVRETFLALKQDVNLIEKYLKQSEGEVLEYTNINLQLIKKTIGLE
jgi:tryptophanyl-tRNA synthetase